MRSPPIVTLTITHTAPITKGYEHAYFPNCLGDIHRLVSAVRVGDVECHARSAPS